MGKECRFVDIARRLDDKSTFLSRGLHNYMRNIDSSMTEIVCEEMIITLRNTLDDIKLDVEDFQAALQSTCSLSLNDDLTNVDRIWNEFINSKDRFWSFIKTIKTINEKNAQIIEHCQHVRASITKIDDLVILIYAMKANIEQNQRV